MSQSNFVGFLADSLWWHSSSDQLSFLLIELSSSNFTGNHSAGISSNSSSVGSVGDSGPKSPGSDTSRVLNFGDLA